MKEPESITFIIFVLILNIFTGCRQPVKEDSYWILFSDPATENCGYLNQNGDTVIPPAKYQQCFIDTFRIYAIVFKENKLVAINREEKVLYEVFSYDNGPDYPSEGAFRIVNNDRVGFADYATGEVIITPQFKCAYPFSNGAAKVSMECSIDSAGPHAEWLSDKWYYINRGENIVKPPAEQ